MKKKYILMGMLVFCCIVNLFVVPDCQAYTDPERINNEKQKKVSAIYTNLPLHFIRNEGQINNTVRFYEKSYGHSTFFTEQGILLALRKGQEIKTVRLNFLNAKGNATIVGEDILRGKVNYFIGNDHNKWKTDIATYGSVRYEGIYDNIDMKFYGNNTHLEYDILIFCQKNSSRS